MILTKSEILTQIAAGNIVILGCSTDSLEDSALDVTMAPVIYEVAENEVDLRKEIKFIRHEIDSDGFTLHPNRFYLGAKELNRFFIGIEKEVKYYELAVGRVFGRHCH